MKKSFLKETLLKFAKVTELDKKKIFSILILVLIVAYFDIRFVVSIQLQALSKTGPKIIKLKNDLNRLDAELKKIQELKKQDSLFRKGLESGVKKIISEDQIVLLMEKISSTANKYDVKVAQIRPQKEAQAKTAKEVKKEKFTLLLIILDLICGYHDFGRFLNELENADIFLNAQEIRIDPQATDYLRQKVLLVLKVYVRE